MIWKADPELHQLREEFIDSLPARLMRLQDLRKQLRDHENFSATLSEIHLMAHNLAGTASIYEFPTLSQISEAVSDGLEGFKITSEIGSYLQLLEEALSEAIRSRQDPNAYLNDSRYKILISFVESLLG